MKKRYLIPLILVAILIGVIVLTKPRKKTLAPLETKVEQGVFEITVVVTGELQAEKSENIEGPPELRSRNLRFGRIKIQDLIPEGTVVKKGDYVATLDRTEADNKLKDFVEEVEQKMSDYEKKRLDTTMQLRQLRDELINLKYNLEEAEITLEQSKFEPPATIRQAQINLDRTKRSYDQAQKNYKLKVKQAVADMKQVSIELAKSQRRQEEMMDILDKFVVRAPSSGMVIYYKEWSGQKRKVGSEISPWELTVATLPDLSSMISKTYVNEIDISKVKVGQKAVVGIDAFPEKKYDGEVIDVANIGEQLKNTDAKVFEVTIKLNNTDSIIRPAMTTSNSILIDRYEDVLYLPLEAVHTEDSTSFVFMKNGSKREVVLGPANENLIIVKEGLKKNEKVLLTLPPTIEKKEKEEENE